MQLFIKQKVFSFSDKYNIFDRNQNLVYLVQGKFFSFGAKFHLTDLNGNELYYIEQKLMSFMGQYNIYKGNTLCANIVNEFAFFKKKIRINSEYGEFRVVGEFFSMNFSIYFNDILIGTIQKEWLTWGDTYMLNIAEEDYDKAAFFCSLIIAIDHCFHNNNN